MNNAQRFNRIIDQFDNEVCDESLYLAIAYGLGPLLQQRTVEDNGEWAATTLHLSWDDGSQTKVVID